MKDYQASLERLRRDAAEAKLIRDLAIDATKREMYNRLAGHFERLADEVEAAIAATTKRAKESPHNKRKESQGNL